MFHPLSSLFGHDKLPWEEADLCYFIQRWLRNRIGSEEINCEHIRGGVASIRVATPALQQAAYLLEYDLGQALQQETQQELAGLRVRI